MADEATQQQTTASKEGAAATTAKQAKDPRSNPKHPPTSEMVNSAIKTLKKRGGSSLVAIKKYIAETYMVDAEKMSPFIKKYLKTAVAAGILVQTKGKGASGSFKLAAAKKTPHDAKEGTRAGIAAAAATKKAPHDSKKGARAGTAAAPH